MILVGELSLWIALLLAIWAATVSYAGGAGKRNDLILSGERAAYAAAAFTGLATAGLWTALFARDFSLAYVASQISANVPNVYVFAALWSGPAGSMLFCALILAGCMAIAVHANRDTSRELLPFVTGTLAVVLACVLAIAAFKANPYARLDWLPADGRGMRPELQNPGMIIHPPALYLGYVTTAVPFAFAVAALITRRFDPEWLATARRWSLASWLFITLGITLGTWWAYVEMGWGRHWAWNPVENASFLPWFTGTALLHSIGIQEKRGRLRAWNVTLVVLAFLLSILATVIVRGGVIESTHWLSRSPVGVWIMGPAFSGAVIIPLSLLLLGLTGIGPLLPSSKVSLSNLWRRFLVPVMSGLVVVAVFAIAGMRSGRALVTYLLTAFVAATIVQEFVKGVGARRSIHGEALALAFTRLMSRNRRRYGGHVVHAGIVLLFAAFAGLAFKRESDVSLTAGQSFETTDPYGSTWRFVSQGVSKSTRMNRDVTTVALEAWRDGRAMGLIMTEKRQYFDSHLRPTFEPTTEVGVRTDARQDVYVVLDGVRGDAADLRIAFNPLVVWVWIGGFVMALGGIIVMWPTADRRRPAGYATVLQAPVGAPRPEAGADATAAATPEELARIAAAVRDDA